MGMLISLAVAFVFTPWLTYKVLRRVVEKHTPAPQPLSQGRGGEAPGGFTRRKLNHPALTPTPP